MSSDLKHNREHLIHGNIVDADVVDADIVVKDKSNDDSACSKALHESGADHSFHEHNIIDVEATTIDKPVKEDTSYDYALSKHMQDESQAIADHLNTTFKKEFSKGALSEITLNKGASANGKSDVLEQDDLTDDDLNDFDLDLDDDLNDISGDLDDDQKELSFDDESDFSRVHRGEGFVFSDDGNEDDISGASSLDDFDHDDALSGMHFMHESHDDAYSLDDDDEISGAALNSLLNIDPRDELVRDDKRKHDAELLKKSNQDLSKRGLQSSALSVLPNGSSSTKALTAPLSKSRDLVIKDSNAYFNPDENSGYDEEDDYKAEREAKLSSSTAVVRAQNPNSIGSFIKAASQIPLLSEEEEKDLARRLRDFGDMDAARKLVLSHLRLVVSVARRYAGYGLPLSDLIQEGNIGLMKSVKHFDPNVGGRLAAFAVHWIKAEIHEYVIRNWRMVKVATTKAQRKLFFKLRQNKKRLGWFTEKERDKVASDLGVTSHDVAEMETRLAGVDIGFDLDDSDSSDHSTALTLSPSAYLEDESSDFAHTFEQSDYANWELKKLREALEKLDDRSRYILQRRWLDETKATLQELSGELKVSIERVRQLENSAMNKVKTLLLTEGVSNDNNASEKDEVIKLPNKTKKRAMKAKSAEDGESSSDGKASSASGDSQSSSDEIKLLDVKPLKKTSSQKGTGKAKTTRKIKVKEGENIEEDSSTESASLENEESPTKIPAKRGRKPKSQKEGDSVEVKALPHLKNSISHDKALIVTKSK